VFYYYGLLIRNREYIEFETLKKQFWSYLRNIKTTINYFFTNVLLKIYPNVSENLAEHWDLPNTGIFYSKDVASGTILNSLLFSHFEKIYCLDLLFKT
jgi:hypothetical protein